MFFEFEEGDFDEGDYDEEFGEHMDKTASTTNAGVGKPTEGQPPPR